jgi:hypothetical protein
MTSKKSLVVGVLFVFALSLGTFGAFSSRHASAGHHLWWVEVRAPFSGTWNLNNWANPASHPIGQWAGDWATDYYAPQYTEGRWYSVTSDGSYHSAKIGLTNNACNKPN